MRVRRNPSDPTISTILLRWWGCFLSRPPYHSPAKSARPAAAGNLLCSGAERCPSRLAREWGPSDGVANGQTGDPQGSASRAGRASRTGAISSLPPVASPLCVYPSCLMTRCDGFTFAPRRLPFHHLSTGRSISSIRSASNACPPRSWPRRVFALSHQIGDATRMIGRLEQVGASPCR